MSQEYTWISRCLVSQTNPEGLIGKFHTNIACTATDNVELYRKLTDLGVQQSFDLLEIESSLLIQQHLDRLDYYDHSSVQLAATAAQQGFAIGDLQPFESKDKAINANGPSYLTIKSLNIEHRYDPNKASWQQPWIDPELKKLIFTETHNAYLLIDATSRNQITTTFDLEDYDDIDVRCLYAGQLAQDLKQHAPYLIDITLSSEQLNDDNLVPKFHRDFFQQHWGKHTGIVIHSEKDIDKIVFHFKKFIKLQDKDGSWFYFRFFDPRAMAHYLESIQRWPQRVAKWFGISKQDQLVSSIICEDQNGKSATSHQVIANNDLQHRGKIELTHEEFKLFQDYRWSQIKKLVSAEITTDFPDETNNINANQIEAWCDQGLAKGYETPRALYDYTYSVLMARAHNFDLNEIEQYLSEQTTSHLEKSKLLYDSIKEAVSKHTTGINT